MKTYKMVDLHLTQQQTQEIIVALQIERDRFFKTSPVKGRKQTKWMDQLIAYTRKQLKEAETPTEVDRLINKIAEW